MSDNGLVHFINFLLALSTIVLLNAIWYKIKYRYLDNFFSYLVFLPMIAFVHIAVFSLTLFVDGLDGVITAPVVVNIWAIFLRMHVCLTALVLCVLAYIKINKDVKI